MGINICLFNKDDEDHPDWDYFRQGHDRDFPKLIDYDKVVYDDLLEWPDSCDSNWRPTDIPELRQRIIDTGWSDVDRYLHLCDLLENNPDYWLYFSI